MKRIMWALAILIIPAFVIWGAGSSNKKDNKTPAYAGKIFNRNVSFDEYVDMWQVARDYAIKTFGTNGPSELINQLAWNRILLLEEAKREHVVVKDPEVVESIVSIPLFQRDGQFDKKLYQSMLGDSARGFEEKLRDDLRISKLKEKISSNIFVTDEEVKHSYIKRFEKVKAFYISIPFSDFEKDVLYQESDLVEFYGNNKSAFIRPEEINVKYIEAPSEETAYLVLDKALKKKNLDEAAHSFSLQTNETGFFNMQQEIPGIGWSYEFTKLSFELKVGEISSMLVKTDNAFYIIQLKEKKASYIPKYLEVKDKVIESYIKNESVKIAEKDALKLYLRINNKIKNKRAFEDIVKEIGLAVTTTDFLMRSDYIPTLGPANEFVEVCASLKNSDAGVPIKMVDSWVIVKLDDYQGIDEAKFLEEKESFKENLLRAKKDEVFGKWFEKLKKESNFVNYLSK